MRCPDCNKFTSLELQGPEVENLGVSVDNVEDGTAQFCITGQVRLVRTCADCGTELKEATLDIEQTVELGEDGDLKAEEITPELLKRLEEGGDLHVEESSITPLEEGGGRYAESYFGAEVAFDLMFEGKTIARVTWSDKIAASGMDEMV